MKNIKIHKKKIVKTSQTNFKAAKKSESIDVSKKNYIFTVGRRKCAIARVRYYKKGNNKITVNDKELNQYFTNFQFQETVNSPLKKIGLKEFGLFSVKVRGGGKHGQAESIRLGIARALVLIDKNYRKVLKTENLLMRDSRVKERKKYGLKRARRAPQWQKR